MVLVLKESGNTPNFANHGVYGIGWGNHAYAFVTSRIRYPIQFLRFHLGRGKKVFDLLTDQQPDLDSDLQQAIQLRRRSKPGENQKRVPIFAFSGLRRSIRHRTLPDPRTC